MSPARLFFDGFELRPGSGELLKEGLPVKLQPQPAKVLEALASRAGQVVSREEIREAVWGESYVDFDASLNFCIKEIRRALGDSATAPRYVETLPRRGYRFLMPVTPEPSPDATPAPPLEARTRPWLTIATVALLAVILFVLVGSRHAQLAKPRLVVLPFECGSGDSAADEACKGITGVITAELTQRFRTDLEVIAPDSARVYAGKSGSEIATGLDATHVLTGNVAISGRQLRLTARLSSTDQDGVLWQESAGTNLGDAPLLYAQIVRGVARGLRLPPPPAEGPLQPSKPSPAAYEAYLRGSYLLKQNSEAAVASLKEAVLLDPKFASAYAKLARAIDSVEKPLCTDGPLIDAAARRALAIDPNLAEAHLALAHSLFHCHLDWDEAGREFQRALALDPGHAETYHLYAFYLAGLGRHGDAIAAARKARELDPVSILMTSDFAYFLYVGRRYDEAIREARKTLDLMAISPESEGTKKFFRFWTLWGLLHAARESGDQEMALGAGKELMNLYGESEKAPGVRTLEDFFRWQESWLKNRPNPIPYFAAVAAMESGHSGPALEALEKDCRTRKSFMLLFAGVEPGLDALHGDPRFTRILDCIRLPADAPARQNRIKERAARSARGDHRPPESSTGS